MMSQMIIQDKAKLMSSSPPKLSNFTINEIVKHHEFINRVQALVIEKTEAYLCQAEPNPENKYLLPENSLIEDFHEVIQNKVENKMKKFGGIDYVNIFVEVSKMKQHIYDFVDQQNRFTANLSKEFHQKLEEIKKKSMSESLDTLASSWSNSRLLRGHSYKSEVGSQKKCQFSVLEELESSIEELRQSVEKGENLTALIEQLNEFKIQTKVSIQSLKHQIKKLNPDEKSPSRPVNPHLKDSIDQAVKRTIKSQLTAYGSYAEEVSSMKRSIENIEQEITSHQNKSNDYFSNQLKSIWLVINKIRDAQEVIAAHVNLKFDDFL